LAEIETHLGTLRRKRGLSAIHLATATGVSRQTIYAIEAGTYVPNTAVALRLAHALGATVEELFALPDLPTETELRAERATILNGAAPPQAGQPVQLCQVDSRLIASPPSALPWYFPATDAIIDGDPASHGKSAVRVFQTEEDFSHRILVAGCDPGISVLSRHAQAVGAELVLAHRNSSQALALLKEGSVHVAGTHLRDEASGESNLPAIARLFPRNSVAVISFAVWEEGILTARNNPKNIRGIADLAGENIAIVNRELGSGSRALLDASLAKLNIEPELIRGYESMATGHLHAAWQVQSGIADCCLATRAAARIFGLHFVPLVTERYDLVIRRRHLDLPRIQNLFDTLSRNAFRRELEGLGGYDTRVAGDRLL
jgi:molybdate-binding protein/DNA-binding XRE family transcriptional regulator